MSYYPHAATNATEPFAEMRHLLIRLRQVDDRSELPEQDRLRHLLGQSYDADTAHELALQLMSFGRRADGLLNQCGGTQPEHLRFAIEESWSSTAHGPCHHYQLTALSSALRHLRSFHDASPRPARWDADAKSDRPLPAPLVFRSSMQRGPHAFDRSDTVIFHALWFTQPHLYAVHRDSSPMVLARPASALSIANACRHEAGIRARLIDVAVTTVATTANPQIRSRSLTLLAHLGRSVMGSDTPLTAVAGVAP